MSNVIPFRAQHPRNGTEIEFSSQGGELLIVAESYIAGKREMGIAFYMDREQEIGLFNWLLARRVVAPAPKTAVLDKEKTNVR